MDYRLWTVDYFFLRAQRVKLCVYREIYFTFIFLVRVNTGVHPYNNISMFNCFIKFIKISLIPFFKGRNCFSKFPNPNFKIPKFLTHMFVVFIPLSIDYGLSFLFLIYRLSTVDYGLFYPCASTKQNIPCGWH
jgi:hypothetical protein